MTDELLAAVEAGDADRVSALISEDPSLANARDGSGVSAILLSRYRSDRAVTDALLAADPDLDIYEAATLGYTDRLNEALATDPALASVVLGRWVHRAPSGGVLRQGRGDAPAPGRRRRRERRVSQLACRSNRSTVRPPAAIARSVASCCGRRERECDAARQLYAAPCGGPPRRRRAHRALPVRGRGPGGTGHRRLDSGGHSRGGRTSRCRPARLREVVGDRLAGRPLGEQGGLGRLERRLARCHSSDRIGDRRQTARRPPATDRPRRPRRPRRWHCST